MTCIAALEHPGGVWIGSDSFLGNEDEVDLIQGPKWVRKGELLIAYAGDVRPAQLLTHCLHVRKRKADEDVEAYLVVEVVASIRRLYAKEAVTSAEAVASSPTEYLFILDGKAFRVWSDLSVLRSPRGFTAIGVGAPFALAALAATADNPDPRARVVKALEVSALLCPAVRAPFVYENADFGRTTRRGLRPACRRGAV